MFSLQGGSNMIVTAIQNERNKNQRSNQWVKPNQSAKNGSKANVENSYQLLQQKAMLAYQR